ncbi:MAG TPA: GyrI-like domain-containing protein [Acidobacteriaceae bacterium]
MCGSQTGLVFTTDFSSAIRLRAVCYFLLPQPGREDMVMIETPQIVRTEPRHYAALQLVVPREQIGRVMGPGVQQIYRVLAIQGIEPSGPWFTHHFKRPNPDFDFEICIPVEEPIESAGEVYPEVWPAMRVARAVFHGDYSRLPGAWGEFTGWIAAQGLREAKDLWEVYTVNPDSEKNPANWRTELNRPLLD